MRTDKLPLLVAGHAVTLTVSLWSPVADLIAGIAAAKESVWDLWLKNGTTELLDTVYTARCALTVDGTEFINPHLHKSSL